MAPPPGPRHRRHRPARRRRQPPYLRRLLLQGGFSLVGVEGQDGAFLRDLPFAGRVCHRRGSGPYRVAERFLPSLLGSKVGAFAIRVIRRLRPAGDRTENIVPEL